MWYTAKGMAQAVAVDTTRRRNLGLLVVGLVAAAAILYLVVSNFSANTVYYLKVSELQSSYHGEQVRVSGKVLPGSISRQGDKLSFTAYDGSGRMRVEYQGVVPDIFKNNADVVVEGTYDGQVFHAHTLLAKCPSKFQSKPSQGYAQ